ncbi:hypothetical protein [Thermodesulfovibrio sp.]|uniref:hypothetical protein n=1 Tax=Thermodesulfovibrio sp. TaxID=2067987 RepID=UPI00309AE386
MLLELENAIIERLGSKGILTHGWSGKPDELFMKPKSFPAVRVVLESADFEEMHFSKVYGAKVRLSLLVFFRSLRDRGSGAYELIEKAIKAITGVTLSGFDLRLQGLSLMYHESGEFCYQVKFTGYGKYVVELDEIEPLVKRITTYEDDEIISDVYSPNP